MDLQMLQFYGGYLDESSSTSSSMPPMKPHVLFFTDPLGINAVQLHSLARDLASAIPEAAFTFLGDQETLLSLRHATPNIKLISFDHCIPNAEFSAGFFERFLAEGTQIYNRMLRVAALVEGRPVTCVISDAFMWIAESVPDVKMPLWIACYFGFSLAMLAYALTERFLCIYGDDEGPPSSAQQTTQTGERIAIPIDDK
ncbi:Anthocyanidin 3-O-glucosyltransferase 2 [Platanthera zijinensis]|uniref:Anthocyanidin 3-O-glucosyltransferase 2 n=1 Tax=Platanthera zijinensis TaxID=2320716 RepID=A0AAP0GEI3_9ASPA